MQWQVNTCVIRSNYPFRIGKIIPIKKQLESLSLYFVTRWTWRQSNSFRWSYSRESIPSRTFWYTFTYMYILIYFHILSAKKWNDSNPAKIITLALYSCEGIQKLWNFDGKPALDLPQFVYSKICHQVHTEAPYKAMLHT